MEEQTCPRCQATFKSENRDRRYCYDCSPSRSGFIVKECERCTARFEVPNASSVRKFCFECSPFRARSKPRSDKGKRKTKWVERTCPECGKTFEVPQWKVAHAERHQTGRIFCGEACVVAHQRSGRMMGEAKGLVGRRPRGTTRFVDPQGYVQVYVPPAERPPGSEKRTNLPEHRIVMAKKLGRHLLPEETVHHKNGDKQDNRPENLELWTGKHQPGQRVADQLAWAREIIARYEPIESSL